MGLEGYAFLVRLLPAVFLFWLTFVVARSPYRTSGNRFLSLFFALLATGFFLEFVVDLVRPVAPAAADGVGALVRVVGIADPPALLAFSLAFPTPQPGLRSRWLWAAVGAAAAGVLAAVFGWGGEPGLWTLTAYVDLTYLAAFSLLLRSFLRERHAFRERQLFFVTLGVGFAGISRCAAVVFEHPDTFPREELFTNFVGGLVTGLGVLALLYLGFLAAWRRRMARAGPLFLWLLALLLAFSVSQHLIARNGVSSLAFNISNQYFGLRWIVVGGILGYGILRHQLFDFELRTRQAVVFLLSLVAGLLAALAAGAAVDDAGEASVPARAVALGTGLGTTLLAYSACTWTWRRLRRGEELPARYRQRRVELYQAALEYALADAQWSLGEHLFADTLREVFQISPAEHEQVMRQIAARPRPPQPPPPAPASA